MPNSMIQWMRNISLKTKLILPTWGLITISLLIGAGVVTKNKIDNADHVLSVRGQIFLKGIANQLISDLIIDNEKSIYDMFQVLWVDPAFLSIVLVDEKNKVIVRSNRLSPDCRMLGHLLHCENTSFLKLSENIRLDTNTLGRLDLYFSKEIIETKTNQFIMILFGFYMCFYQCTLFFLQNSLLDHTATSSAPSINVEYDSNRKVCTAFTNFMQG